MVWTQFLSMWRVWLDVFKCAFHCRVDVQKNSNARKSVHVLQIRIVDRTDFKKENVRSIRDMKLFPESRVGPCFTSLPTRRRCRPSGSRFCFGLWWRLQEFGATCCVIAPHRTFLSRPFQNRPQTLIEPSSANGIRTRVPALRGQCPRPLDDSAVLGEGRDPSAPRPRAQTVFRQTQYLAASLAASRSASSSGDFAGFSFRSGCGPGSKRHASDLRSNSTRGFTTGSIFSIRSQYRL